MKLFRPQVNLRRKQNTNDYCIHSITFTDNAQYRATGINSPQEVEGGYEIVIKLAQDNTNGYPDMEYITPVVHTTEYQSLSLSASNPYLFVTVENGTNSGDADGIRLHYADADLDLGGID